MKIVFIGAGSAFGGRLSVDILSREPLQNSTIALCDISQERLDTVAAYVRKVVAANKLSAKVVASTDRREPALQALLLDPITSANLTIAQARSMFDELWAAEGELVQGYA